MKKQILLKSILMAVVFATLVACHLSLSSPAQAADITLKWDASQGATGYKLYRSVDNGTTWTMVQDVGAVTEITLTGQPDTGTVIYRVGAYNASGEAIRFWSGAWYNKSWEPPAQPTGAGVR